MAKKNDKTKTAAGKAGHEEKWQEVMDKLGQLAKDAKKKYDQIDPATKKKVAIAAVGALTALAVAFGAKKAKKK